MKVIYGIGKVDKTFKEAVLAIGVFDGLHMGHQKLIKAAVKRAKKIRVKGLSEEGKNIEIEAEGLLARAIQHEVDHLNGILMIDRITYARRQLLSSQLKKLEKAHA